MAGSNIKLFLRDADTPNVTRSCSKQKEFGIKVKDIVTKMLTAASSIKLKNFRKTSKAVIANVIVDGKDLGKELLAKGYASAEYGYWKSYFCDDNLALNKAQIYQMRGDMEMTTFWYDRVKAINPNRSID